MSAQNAAMRATGGFFGVIGNSSVEYATSAAPNENMPLELMNTVVYLQRGVHAHTHTVNKCFDMRVLRGVYKFSHSCVACSNATAGNPDRVAGATHTFGRKTGIHW